MYGIVEQTEQEVKARSLVRISERLEETARFMGPREKVMIHFGERGLLPLSSGEIHRTTYRRPHREQNPGSVVLQLHGFDHDYFGDEKAVVIGVWGSEYMAKDHVRGRVRYMGGLELLPEDFVQDAIALLEHRGGIDIERAPWDED